MRRLLIVPFVVLALLLGGALAPPAAFADTVADRGDAAGDPGNDDAPLAAGETGTLAPLPLVRFAFAPPATNLPPPPPLDAPFRPPIS